MGRVNVLKWKHHVLVTGTALLCTMTALADADQNQSADNLTIGVVKSGTLSKSIFDPSNAGTSTSSVNLYTGQHQESFPLISMPGRGGLGFEVSLDYSGIAYRQAKKENRKGQSSDFGLGFSVGMQSIVTDHKNTLDLADDEYRLIAGSSAIELKKKSDTQYVTITGDPWVINKHVATVSGRTLVTGWTIIKEDGTICRFGDFSTSYSNWNATRQMLRYGDFVGNGITNTDSLFPFQWDMKVVHDRDSLNWVTISYVRDQRSAQVRSTSNGSLVNSTNTYTATSHLGILQTSDGASSQFYYSSRNDSDLYFGLNNQEFIAYQKCDSVIARASDNSVVTRLTFEFSYINSSMYASYGAPFEKLLLRRIRSWSIDNTQSLPPLLFDYDSTQSSPTFGAMIAITYPQGGIKRIGYKALASGSNFGRLDATVVDSSSTMPQSWVSDNIFVVQQANGTWMRGIWDGYWRIDTVTATALLSDGPAVSPDAWAAVPASANDSTIWVYRWKGGYWVVDTITNGPRRSVEYPAMHLFVGKDCFIAVNAESFLDHSRTTEVKYYHWNGRRWKSRLIWSGASWRYHQVNTSQNNVFILSTFRYFSSTCQGCSDSSMNYLDYGRYDPVQDSIYIEPEYSLNDGNQIGRDVVAGHQYVAWLPWDGARWRRWNGSVWVADSIVIGGSNSFAPLPNGWAWNHSASNGSYSRLEMCVPSGNSNGFDLVTVFFNDNSDNKLSGLYGGNNFLGAQYQTTANIHLFGWDGTYWQLLHLVRDEDPTYAFDFQNFSSSWVFGPHRNATAYRSTVTARSYRGVSDSLQNRWTDQTLVNIENGPKDGFAAAPDYFLCRAIHQNRLYLYDLYNHGETWNAEIINQDTAFGGYDPMSCYYASQGSFEMWNRNAMHKDSTRDSSLHIWLYSFSDYRYWYSTYRVCDSVFAGVAPIFVVDSVSTYRFADDSRPVIQKYKYYGGLLDASAMTPRFARAEVSTPYYADTVPVGYEAHCFYNDIDTAGFYDPSIYSSMHFPKLTDSVRYGIPNGGFRLDGTEYLAYSYTVGDDTTKRNDTTRTYHSIHKTMDSLPDVYLTRVDSVHTRADSLSQDVSYRYDDSTGQATSTRTRYVDASHALVDSIIYAYRNNSQIRGDNAVSLVKDRISLYDSTSGVRVLARSRATYVRKGGWKTAKSYTWREPSTLADSIYSDTLLSNGRSFDEVGNVVVSINGIGDTSCVKYNNGHSLPIATASHAGPWDLLVQDLEQPDGWDSWSFGLVGSAVTMVVDSPFTGSKALKLHCTAGSGSKVEALSRTILADSLTDTLYAASYWVRANHRAYLRVKVFNGTILLDSLVAEYVPPTASSGNTWRQVLKALKIRRSYVLFPDTTHLTPTSVTTNFVADPVSFDTNYVVVDNIRFHRMGAQVSTSVYGNGGVVVSASLGSDNVPVRSDFDKFLHPVAGRDFRGDTLSKTEVLFSTVADSVRVHCSTPTTDSVSTVILDPGIVTFTLKAMYGLSPTPHAYVYQNGVKIYELIASVPDVEATYSGSFSAAPNDTIKVKVFQTSSDASATSTARFTRWGSKSVLPNYARSTSFISSSQSIVSVSYADGFGRTIETRTRDSVNGAERAIVFGLTAYDARGRVLKTYKPYHDLDGSTGLMDFSPWSTAIAEVRNYYDGNPGPNCDTFPYSENVYATTVKGEPKETGGPGTLYRVGAGHTSHYRGGTDTTRKVIFSAATDPDNIRDTAETDQWGRWAKSADTVRVNDTLNTVITTTWKDIRGRDTAVTIDNGGAMITLRKTWYNDLGQEISTWKVDYGTIRMKYDKAGSLRFMQNDLRLQENKFVYFKYDALGRKIEEGIMGGSSTYFNNQDSADSRTFPAPPNGPEVKYRWTYDFYISGTDTIIAPGKLVRVSDANSVYYRIFKYCPTTFSDTTIIKLLGLSALKRIIHDYNRDGSISKLTVWSHYPNSGKRVYLYDYDVAGRLKTVYAPSNEGTDYQHYTEYEYNPDGSVKLTRLGVSGDGSFLPPVNDTVQVVNYSYDPLGRLITQNNVGSVFGPLDSSGASHDHFAQQLTYVDSTGGYYDGRLWKNRTVHSVGSGVSSYLWKYTYDDLGELTYADRLGDSASDQRFAYDWMGRRTSSTTYSPQGVPDTITYEYDSSPGSSKLIRYKGMPPGKYLRYDVLGNLTSDSARDILAMTWDYRNLMLQARSSSITSGYYNTVDCEYDEAGNRLKKNYGWYYWTSCGGIEGPLGPEMVATGTTLDTGLVAPTDTLGGSMIAPDGGMYSTSGTQQCPAPASSYTFYLYDRGNLLSTFDGAGNVIDMYVVGPSGGRIATYYQNSTTQLQYFMGDHLGSTGVMMKGNSPYAVSAYYDYSPFGQTISSYQSYATPMQWTNHEHDQNGSFDYYNFGARLYDPKVGLFLTPDKAGQFASGYVYGGNTPVMGVDEDGNLFWFPIILGALAGGYSGAQIAHAQNGDVLGGIFGGALIGALSGLTGGAVAGAVHNPVAGGLLAGAAGGGVNGLGMAGLAGGDVGTGFWHSAVAGAAGGWMSGMIGGVGGSFAGGFVSGATGYGLGRGKSGHLGGALAAGFISGSVSTASYAVEASIRHGRKIGNGDEPGVNDSKIRRTIESRGRMSFVEGKENGMWFTKDGGTDLKDGTRYGVDMYPQPEGEKGWLHFHHKTGGTEILPSGRSVKFLPYHSPIDIDVANALFLERGTATTSWVVNPRNVYAYNVAFRAVGINSPILIGATDYYFMVHYYNLAYYGNGR